MYPELYWFIRGVSFTTLNLLSIKHCDRKNYRKITLGENVVVNEHQRQFSKAILCLMLSNAVTCSVSRYVAPDRQ